MLRHLREDGKKIGLISNADVMEVAAWARCPICDLFDVTVFSCEVGYVKPETEIYRCCLDQLGVTPTEAVFVGDGGSNELEGAKALGISTIMIAGIIREIWPDRISQRRVHADFMIETLTELISSDENKEPNHPSEPTSPSRGGLS